MSAGKLLIIGGGIANFTNVAATFKGIIHALQDFKGRLIQHKVSVWVRRGGPNFQEGLKLMRELGEVLGVPIHVCGPETHITAIVPLALGLVKAKVRVIFAFHNQQSQLDTSTQPSFTDQLFTSSVPTPESNSVSSLPSESLALRTEEIIHHTSQGLISSRDLSDAEGILPHLPIDA